MARVESPAIDPRSATLELALLLPASLSARPQAEPIRVAAASCPPFVISEEGELSGLGVFLWNRVAREMGVEYQITEDPLNEMLKRIAEPHNQRKVDVGVSCLSITAERERSIGFSHSFHETNIGIAVRQRGLGEAIRSLFAHPAVLEGLGFVLGAAILVGGVLFLLEHSAHPKIYSMTARARKALEGLLVGLLFVTRGPFRFSEFKTMTARTLAAIPGIGSTLLVAGITAVLASAFTLEGLRSPVTGLEDLDHVRVGALEASTSSTFLQDRGITHRTHADLAALVADLDRGRIDAVVSDASFLKYTLRNAREQGESESLSLLPHEFEKQNYGSALQEDSGLLEAVNQALLTVRKRPEWRREVFQ